MHMPCACHAHAVRVPCAHHTYGPLCACPTHALYRKTRACPTPVPDSIFGKANAGYDPVGLDQSDNRHDPLHTQTPTPTRTLTLNPNPKP